MAIKAQSNTKHNIFGCKSPHSPAALNHSVVQAFKDKEKDKENINFQRKDYDYIQSFFLKSLGQCRDKVRPLPFFCICALAAKFTTYTGTCMQHEKPILQRKGCRTKKLIFSCCPYLTSSILVQ